MSLPKFDPVEAKLYSKYPPSTHLKHLLFSNKLFGYYQTLKVVYPFVFCFENGGYLFKRIDIYGRFVFPAFQLLSLADMFWIWGTCYLNFKEYLGKKEYFEVAFHTTWSFCWFIGFTMLLHLRVARNSLPSFITGR